MVVAIFPNFAESNREGIRDYNFTSQRSITDTPLQLWYAKEML